MDCWRKMRKFDLSLRSSRSSYFATFRHQLTILSKTDALDEEKWLNMLGTFVKDWFRYESHFVHGRDSLVDILKERGLLVSVSCAYTQGKREQFSGFNRTLDAINNVFRKFSAFHDETGRLNVDGMNIISNDGSNKLNRSRKARVSYKVQRTINASLNAATSTRAVSSNPNFVTRQKIEIIFGKIQNGRSLNELNRGQSGLETYGLFSNLTHDFLPISG